MAYSTTDLSRGRDRLGSSGVADSVRVQCFRALPRADERQPRFRQLHFGGLERCVPSRDSRSGFANLTLRADPRRDVASAWRAAICAWRRRSTYLAEPALRLDTGLSAFDLQAKQDAPDSLVRAAARLEVLVRRRHELAAAFSWRSRATRRGSTRSTDRRPRFSRSASRVRRARGSGFAAECPAQRHVGDGGLRARHRGKATHS